METVVCSASSEKIQDEILVAKLEEDDVHFSSTKPSVSIPKSDNSEKYSFEGKVNQIKDKETSPMLNKNESGHTTDTLSSKSLSPTLIEHALKVVKNIFSPDKNRSRPPSVLTTVSQQHCASGSPRNSLLVTNKSDIFPDSGVEFSNLGISADTNFKGDPLNSDQTALSSMTPSQDSLNNTNDSFLTTVSLIEESFQSAVTHLDNADGNNGEIDTSGIFSSSRNLDVMDSNNDTLSGSEYGLENTILKNGSFISVESLLNNISDNCDKNILEGPFKEYIGDIKEKPQSVGEEKNYESNAVVSESCETLNVNENLKKKYPVLKNSEQTKENFDANAPFMNEDEENIEIKKAAEIKELIVSKTTDECLNDSGMTLNKLNDALVIGNDLSSPKFKNCLLPKVENSQNNILEKEIAKNTDNTISTTTIILSETDSDCCNTINLTKDNENAPPDFYENINNSSPKALKEFFSNKNIKTTNILSCARSLDGDNRVEKKGSKSSGNTPIKMLKANKNKLNKSLDSVTRKNIYNSPKGKKSFRQQLAEDFALSVSKQNYSKNSPNYCTTEIGEIPKNSEVPLGISEEKGRIEYSIADENCSSTTSFIQDTNSLSSQQSYTILNTSDTSLKRPVINSFEDFKEEISKTPHSSPSYTITNNLKIKKTYSDLSNDCSNLRNEEAHSVLAKRSTPEFLSNNLNTLFFPSDNQPLSLISTSPPANDFHPDDKNLPSLPSELEFSPVIPDESEVFPFVHSVEKQVISTSSPRRTPPLKNVNFNQEKTSNLLNKTLNDSTKTPESSNLNQTFDIKPGSQESNKGNDTYDLKTGTQTFTKLNETFDLHPEPQTSETIIKMFNSKSDTGTVDGIYKTLDLKPGSQTTNKMNETFDKKPDTLNETFDIKADPQFDVKLNQTFENKKMNEDSPLKISKESNTNSKNAEENKLLQEKSTTQNKPLSTVVLEPNYGRPDLLETLVENRECLNSSFISTTSSNTSLLCNNNLTVLLNQESSRSVSSQDVTSGDAKPDQFLSAENEEWSDTYSRPPSAEKSINSENAPSDSKVNDLFKDDKVQCDSDLEKFIQKEFTNTEIEKICSVVDDFSIAKPAIQITNNCLGLSDEGAKENESDETSHKFFNPLSPHSFDFLNSIGGKPTGRDWSRESLYVKFDPLVQAPNANSLIDFTKEAEDLQGSFESPAVNDTAVEHLLSISPQKKSEEIVPPLTPFSHKNKNAVNRDEVEKLKELQNEIYFLKNLYAEREKTNKNKLDNYETQITKLTGQSCVLENNLRESNEREKSLVRKLQEQKQSITQMKLIMEEYIKVITKLTTELEKLKSENSKKLEALTAEKDSYVTHLQNTEAAFTDVHAKYEKSKKTIVNLKTNEAMFRQTLAEQMQKMEEYKEKTKDAQERACKEMQRLQDELTETKASHSQETARLRAQLRKTELKLEAVQESLDQKIKENHQLTAICDELIEGKK